jgi:hypothetical protein
MKGKSDVMTLCSKCKRDYVNTGGYYIRRTYNEKDGMERCTKCPKDGWEYEITPKEKRGRR